MARTGCPPWLAHRPAAGGLISSVEKRCSRRCAKRVSRRSPQRGRRRVSSVLPGSASRRPPGRCPTPWAAACRRWSRSTSADQHRGDHRSDQEAPSGIPRGRPVACAAVVADGHIDGETPGSDARPSLGRRTELRLFDDDARGLDRFAAVLILTIGSVVALSLLDLEAIESDVVRAVSTLVLSLMTGATFVLALRSSGVVRRWRRFSEVLALLAVAITLVQLIAELASEGDSISFARRRLEDASRPALERHFRHGPGADALARPWSAMSVQGRAARKIRWPDD